MRIKQGVTLHGLCPQIVLAVIAAQEEYGKYNTEVVITSGNDGRHSTTSLHYSGHAVDLRTRNLPTSLVDGPEIASSLSEKLGRDFDVLFEEDHIHIEYQPRRPE